MASTVFGGTVLSNIPQWTTSCISCAARAVTPNIIPTNKTRTILQLRIFIKCLQRTPRKKRSDVLPHENVGQNVRCRRMGDDDMRTRLNRVLNGFQF